MQDCIEYVRVKMYNNTRKGDTSDDESVSEDRPAASNNESTTAADLDAEGDPEVEQSVGKTSNNSNKNNSDSEYNEEDESDSDTSKDDDNKIIDVPNNYLFPSFLYSLHTVH